MPFNQKLFDIKSSKIVIFNMYVIHFNIGYGNKQVFILISSQLGASFLAIKFWSSREFLIVLLNGMPLFKSCIKRRAQCVSYLSNGKWLMCIRALRAETLSSVVTHGAARNIAIQLRKRQIKSFALWARNLSQSYILRTLS